MAENRLEVLSGMAKEDLIQIILGFVKLRRENSEWLDYKLDLSAGLPQSFEACKKRIRHALFAGRIDLHSARQAVLDFKRLRPETALLLDLMVSYVETGIEVENEYGDLYESFYSSMESMYISALKLLKGNPALIRQFKPRIEKIISRSAEGWGHRDTLQDYCEMLLEGKLDGEEGGKDEI